MRNSLDKQYHQIIDEAYKNYVSTHENFEWTDDFCKKNLKDCGDQWDVFTQEEFINKCKTDEEFAKKWGIIIYTEVVDDIVWMGIVYNGNATKIKIK